jgi:hypothetical protein
LSSEGRVPNASRADSRLGERSCQETRPGLGPDKRCIGNKGLILPKTAGRAATGMLTSNFLKSC